jgi:hypothetical protein
VAAVVQLGEFGFEQTLLMIEDEDLPGVPIEGEFVYCEICLNRIVADFEGGITDQFERLAVFVVDVDVQSCFSFSHAIECSDIDCFSEGELLVLIVEDEFVVAGDVDVDDPFVGDDVAVVAEDGEFDVVEYFDFGYVGRGLYAEAAGGEVEVVDDDFVVLEEGDEFVLEVDGVDEGFEGFEVVDVVDDGVFDLFVGEAGGVVGEGVDQFQFSGFIESDGAELRW